MAEVRLPRIRAADPIASPKDGRAVTVFIRFWDTFARAIESRDSDLQAQIDRINTSLRAISHADGMTLTAEADGAKAKVTVSAHKRVYTDITVDVNAGEIDGLEYDTVYSVYYDDENRAGGDVTFIATVNPTDAVTSAVHKARHLVGVVKTPANSTSPPVDGGGTRPPGFPPGDMYIDP